MRRWITYFVREPLSGAVSIGRTFEGSSRIKDLQVCNPGLLEVIGVLAGDVGHEMHQKLAVHRIHGEWFRPHPDVLAAAATGVEFLMLRGCIHILRLPGESEPERHFTRPLSARHAKLPNIPGRENMLKVLNAVIGNPQYRSTKRTTSMVLSRLIRLGFVVQADGRHWATLKATGGIPESELPTE